MARDKPLSFFHQIVKSEASANPNYHRCGQPRVESGICAMIDEFEAHVSNGTDPPADRLNQYRDLAYVLWLLGTRLPHREVIKSRMSQSFSGTTYYEPGNSGFRQFEFELQVIARLAEEEIEFEDIEGDGEPDLLVKHDGREFVIEIKMPTSDLRGAISKALKQIFGRADFGAIVLGVDCLVATGEDHEALCREAYDKLKDKAIAACLEYSDHSPEGSPGCYFSGSKCPLFVEPLLKRIMSGDRGSILM